MFRVIAEIDIERTLIIKFFSDARLMRPGVGNEPRVEF